MRGSECARGLKRKAPALDLASHGAAHDDKGPRGLGRGDNAPPQPTKSGEIKEDEAIKVPNVLWKGEIMTDWDGSIREEESRGEM